MSTRETRKVGTFSLGAGAATSAPTPSGKCRELEPFRAPTPRDFAQLDANFAALRRSRRPSTDKELTPSAPGQPGAILSFGPARDGGENMGRTAPGAVRPSTLGEHPSRARKRPSGVVRA